MKQDVISLHNKNLKQKSITDFFIKKLMLIDALIDPFYFKILHLFSKRFKKKIYYYHLVKSIYIPKNYQVIFL